MRPPADGAGAAETRTYPGARRPDRTRRVGTSGVDLAVYEWGDDAAPPLLLAHGGFDFAGTFDVFAPMLADGGWRVVSWDQRGHGDSARAALYQLEADMRDALAVLDSVTDEPIPVVGHSKGGSLTTQIAAALPHRVASVVNIDGVPSRRAMPDVQDRDRTKLLAADLAGWLDRRHLAAGAVRTPGTIEELARRRARMNPRLEPAWLEYLVTVGGYRADDGWRWKIDPTLRLGGFGPWRPEWALRRLPDVAAPLLVLLGTEPETMGWDTTAADVRPYLPPRGRVVEVDGAGHFVHIERPEWTAGTVLDHLGAPDPSRSRRVRRDRDHPEPGGAPAPDDQGSRRVAGDRDDGLGSALKGPTRLRHNRIDLALWELRGGEGRPLLVLHGLGERTDPAVLPALEGWPGPVHGLDFTGHGASTVPVGGGYFCEILMGDADVALQHLGEATVLGRGLGGYVALLIAGARPRQVRGAIIADGPGLHGAGPTPASLDLSRPPQTGRTPDPVAMVELARDIRPPDYARTFAWQASALSDLDAAIAVAAVNRPPWLAEVAAQPGVAECDLVTALAMFGSRRPAGAAPAAP